jgi:hypothetical protein
MSLGKLTKVGATLALVGGAALLCGCPNPNTYGTPRTTPKGQLAHTVAIEAFHFRFSTNRAVTSGGTTTVQKVDDSVTLPTFPTYQLRYGISDEMDFGIRVANLSTLGGDFKVNFLKSDSFDMAVDPGFQFLYIGGVTGSNGQSSSATIFTLHLPLLLGLNLGDNFTLVGTPGIVYTIVSGTASSEGSSAAATNAGVAARFGLGFNIRLSDGFALHPEVTAMKYFQEAEATLILFGLGFNFGRQPKYGKAADPAPAPTPAPAPAPAPQ